MALQRRYVSVLYSDGRVSRNPLRPLVEMHFERVYKVGITRAFDGDLGATNLYRLAWEVERSSNGGTIKPLEEWLEGVDVVDVEVEPVPPTAAAPSGDTSPSSPSPPG